MALKEIEPLKKEKPLVGLGTGLGMPEEGKSSTANPSTECHSSDPEAYPAYGISSCNKRESIEDGLC